MLHLDSLAANLCEVFESLRSRVSGDNDLDIAREAFREPKGNVTFLPSVSIKEAFYSLNNNDDSI
jgi:hypothetical protein